MNFSFVVPSEEVKGPQITSFPQSLTVGVGKSATFTVESKESIKNGM
jgi:hypothetical protein